jgi:hypothetical protein
MPSAFLALFCWVCGIPNDSPGWYNYSYPSGLLIFLSFVTLGLAGSILSTNLAGSIPLPFVQVDVAVPVLSLVVAIPSCVLQRSICSSLAEVICRLVIDYFRKGAFTSMVVVELIWTCKATFYLSIGIQRIYISVPLAILSILWLAAAGATTGISVTNSCDCGYTFVGLLSFLY